MYVNGAPFSSNLTSLSVLFGKKQLYYLSAIRYIYYNIYCYINICTCFVFDLRPILPAFEMCCYYILLRKEKSTRKKGWILIEC